jgi:hypothetical protein
VGSFYPDFARLYRAGGEKVASSGPEALMLWNSMKAAASMDPAGRHVGLAKIAIELWSDHLDATGEKTASSFDEREQWAASFASASIVDDAFDKMATAGEINTSEHTKLSIINAVSAMSDLSEMTKMSFLGASSMAGIGKMLAPMGHAMKWLKDNPKGLAAIVGATVGAAMGASKDEDNRVRGALVGALPGAAIGVTVASNEFLHGAKTGAVKIALPIPGSAPGQMQGPAAAGPPDQTGMGQPADYSFSGMGATGGSQGAAGMPGQEGSAQQMGGDPNQQMGGDPNQPMDDQMQNPGMQNAQQAQEAAMQDTARHLENLETLKYVAESTKNMGFRSELEQRAEEMLQHLAGGNVSLPAWAQRHFPTADHAKHFAEVVQKRTTPLFGKGGGGKK